MMLGRFETWLAGYSEYGYTVLRIGTGLFILLAGLHKLIAPEIWSSYAAPVFVNASPFPFETLMVAGGVFEVVMGLAVLLSFYTATAAFLTALFMLAVVVNILVTGAFVDIVIRDVGLFFLSLGTAVLSAGKERSKAVA